MKMKFWTGNKADGEFERSADEVAGLFVTAMNRAWQHRLTASSDEQLMKLEHWPLERTLRDWMTSEDGFNASWEDEAGFTGILSKVREMMAAGRL